MFEVCPRDFGLVGKLGGLECVEVYIANEVGFAVVAHEHACVGVNAVDDNVVRLEQLFHHHAPLPQLDGFRHGAMRCVAGCVRGK